MAKKLVARIRFDDGSKRVQNASVDYAIGEEYKGDNAAALEKKGFLCEEKDLQVKAAVDEKDKVIAGLEKQIKALKKEIEELKSVDADKAPKVPKE